MLLSEMFGVERGEWFKVEGGGKALYKISAVEDNIEFLEVNYGGEKGWEFAKMNMLLCVINAAPANIIHLPPPLTDEQRDQLRALHTLTFRWIVKNKKGVVVAYSHKPYRYDEYWATENVDANIQSVAKELSVCSLVSWSDNEPYDISKALGVGK